MQASWHAWHSGCITHLSDDEVWTIMVNLGEVLGHLATCILTLLTIYPRLLSILKVINDLASMYLNLQEVMVERG